MDLEAFRTYCLSKKGTSEDFPFDEVTLCLRVVGKIFAITGLDSETFTVALKCDPEEAIELRERYEDIQPGYHMNKKHWNTVTFDGTLDDNLLRRLIDMSYDLVVKSLKKAERQALEAL
ncbi:MAG: MmcQ/YjbR family DNA-binding protein [Saprospiraceae bacterium]|nr:MmcQ/YjbR family DNA-binding protein [Saprospiraceae bacterium]